ncbi:MAG TPA: DAK2 domain-containing protein [Dehalococcoidia bacterium]|nr:DAK2 domain-containing protein [Dehalococcoidia bacterium]
MPEPHQPPAPIGPPAARQIDGPALARAFAAALDALRGQADALNAINVFPVPDGDTGTNMSLTMRAAVEEIARAGEPTLSNVSAAAARGTLMGAKGNSGVILSQIVGAFAAAGATPLDAPALAAVLERGRVAAYHVVSKPREGTILTAIAAAATAAASCADDTPAGDVLTAAVAAAHDAARRSPELMPLLREAGVVDAGAQGLYILLDAMARSINGTGAAPPERLAAIDARWLAATARAHGDGDRSGYCTEFVVHAPSFDEAALRARFAALGTSVLVVRAGGLARVHLHTAEPEAAFAAARALGTLSDEKADDMEAQFQRLMRDAAAPATRAGIAVVAVAAGDGIQALLRSIGAAAIVPGGQTMNPAAGDIRAAIDATGAAEVIVLPDNANVVMAARQAAEGAAARVRVLSATSIPEGVAALVALNTEASFEDNVAAMEQAIATVRTGEVTLAARATRIHGMEVAAGQPIGLVDGDLAVAERSVADAVRACVRRMCEGRSGALVTLYAGERVTMTEAEAVASAIRAELHVDVELVQGGQPHYPYVIGVE